MPATFHAQCRPGSNSVTTNGTPNRNDVRTTPVAPNDSSVCGESSEAPLTVGPHRGHASRSTRTSHAADGGAANQTTGTLSATGSAIYAPWVNGDLPGPHLMADPFGQCVMVQIR